MAPDLYLDANATSPVLPSAIAAAVEAMEASFGNPSSSHATGLRAKRILDTTRARARRVQEFDAAQVAHTAAVICRGTDVDGLACATLGATRDAGAMTLHGRAAHNAPLSRLAEHLPEWLADPARPIVFMCRSGNRSAKAALCLRRAGHAQAWTVVGGLALA
jgi:rhodanese-related sulfurtransferase